MIHGPLSPFAIFLIRFLFCQFFCSASVDQDAEASLPHKLLMFGFAFFILIVVSLK